MTDAPEKIWAFPKKDWFNAGASTHKITAAGSKDVAYIREDVAQELEAKLEKALKAGIHVAASLAAAISLLERGGKKAAPSDKMFAQMLVDYSASLDRFRATLAELGEVLP